MKTTLVIDDTVMLRLREEAARTQRTMSELVETALRLMLEAKPEAASPRPSLPTFHGGLPRVDIANRDALYDAMEERR